ncbi:hypothetical protein [Thalassolituus sp.]|uniref:hypothetical protein n=1 Tax=Thalassolituus sp. TaxID=2030822 RepID=UPI0035175D47
MIKVVLKGFGALVTLIAVGLAAWWSIKFAPHIDDINADVLSAEGEYSGDLGGLYRLVLIAETESGIARYASSSAYARLSFETGVIWSLNGFLWHVSIRMLLSEQEEFYLWLKAAKLNQLAQQHFGHPILELPLEERAVVVGMVKSPSVFAPGTDRERERTQKILKAYNAS